jgi:rhodanese-related sulfurtransferase
MIRQIDPKLAWSLLQDHPETVLIDVRDPLEFSLVGHPPGAVNIPWKFVPDWRINENFTAQVRQTIGDPHRPLLLLCRSGQRSQEAAEALQAAGFSDLYNVQEGFEGPLDSSRHRSSLAGWRFRGLPWEQS